MSDPDYEKGKCPTCGSDRADVRAEHRTQFRSQDYDANSDYRILECRGCGEIYFKIVHTNSHDIDYIPNDEVPGGYEPACVETITFWPKYGPRKRPEWLDDLRYEDVILGRLLDDVYTAMNSDLPVLAAIGMRTTFDRASERLSIDPGLRFADKLKAMKDGGHITSKEEKTLESLVEAGNAAAHRGWRPKPNLVEAMIIILETFLHRTFILPGLGMELQEDVPKRNTKKPNKKNDI